MMTDKSAVKEITELAGSRAKCYALKVEHSDSKWKQMNIDVSNFASAETSYTRLIYGRMPGLITSLTKYISDALRSSVKDNISGVVSEEIKKDKGMKKAIAAKEIMCEDYKGCVIHRKATILQDEYDS